MKKDLMEKYRHLKEHNFEVPAEKVWTEEYIANILDSMTKEDLEKEIDFLDDYVYFLKLSYHKLFEYDEEESELAFSPQEIYRLWLEKDMALYDVLSECTDDYIQDVIEYWVARQYDQEAIKMLADYKTKRIEFSNK